jgi:NADPH:quinone reductase-like Zn-dependent oxidoreductase
VKELELRTVMRKRARLIGSTLRARSYAFKAALVAKFAKDFGAELRRGALRPVIDKVGPFVADRLCRAPPCLPLHACPRMRAWPCADQRGGAD